MKFTAIAIIYNPASTGPSGQLAKDLRRQLRRAMPELRSKITTVPTKRANHAETLAYELAKASKRPLIIASGGDGSYHEVVNGAMRAAGEGARPVCGLLPGGNANDHYQALHSGNMVERVINGHLSSIDLMHIESRPAQGRRRDTTAHGLQRFAHSYCGFGLTAEAGRELNQHQLNQFREAWIVLRTLHRLRASRVLVNGRRQAYASLVCSNIHRMSKFLRVSATPQVRDGKFEITAIRGSNKRRLIMALLRASTSGFQEIRQTDSFTFVTIRPMRLQIDGEIYQLPADTEVRVTIRPRALHCIV